ncbi:MULTISPECIES: hypothetical protein [unclassified Janthinobacterium]|uniref:hypothetical protein n=1 Tax=unclassified Janthinobacterium TaxID=2610881 RepID=UPI00036EF260|nr:MULTISPECIES: hypothetical protein [unclassified Janthinobacterium]MEC5160313.1 hypothetical protein [Janthinobacterium sp. CG_S6]
MMKPLIRTVFLTTLLSPVLAVASCEDIGGSPSLQDYAGDIGGKYKIQLTLAFKGDSVSGEYFYLSQLKGIPLRAVSGDRNKLVLEERGANGEVTASFTGALSADCGKFDGTWQKTGSSSKLPYSLKHTESNSGSLGHRYYTAGAESDDIVHANAYKFWLGVKNGDKKAVTSVLAYPVRAQIAGKKTTFRNANEFSAKYDAVFSPAYRQAVIDAVPRNMGSSWRGVMLGEQGEVWLNHLGKPFALNN